MSRVSSKQPRLNRLAVELRAMLPEPKCLPHNYCWIGVCDLSKSRK